MHGLRARWSAAGLEIDGPRAGAPTVVHEVRAGVVSGAVYGPVSDPEARALVDALSRGGDPGGPDAPWFGIATTPSGGLAASASMMLSSGVFWSSVDGELRVASDPAAAAGESLRLDEDYIRSCSEGITPPLSAPFAGVARMTAGSTLVFDAPAVAPRIRQWCGPDVWGEPDLHGPEAMAAYLAAFDAVVEDLASRTTSLVATVSGGLDSSFVASSLALRADDGRRIRGLVYAPLPGANVPADADETQLALLMAERFPDRLFVETVTNSGGVHPLEAARIEAARSGVPVFNPANQPWLDRMRSIADEDGASLWFVGTNGNAAFSYHHPYAAEYYLRRVDVRGLVSLARGGGLRSRVLGPLRRSLDSRAGERQMGRGEYLRWLARSMTGLPAAANPAAMEGVLIADPFASRAVIEVAAAITPSEWVRGPLARGFARRAGAGRVPDQIRLRRGRGLQGRDAWFVIKDDRDGYLDRVRAVRNVRGLEHVRVDDLEARVSAWPWGADSGPAWLDQVSVDRLLGIAEFAEVWSAAARGVTSLREES